MFRIKNIDAFKKSLDQISLFVDECNVHFNDLGIKITALDSAQIVYLEYFLDKQGIDGELPSTIFGINVSEFNKILSKVNANDKLFLDIKEQNLDLIIETEYKKIFSLPHKIVDEKNLDIDLEKYSITFTKKTELLKDIFGCAKLVSDSLIFECNDENILIKAEGIYGKYQTNLEIKKSCDLKAKFSSTHLNNMLKNAPNEKEVEIKLSEKFPFYISYNFSDNYLKFFLAHMFI